MKMNENPTNIDRDLDFDVKGGEQVEDNTQSMEPQGDVSGAKPYVTR